MEVYLIRHTAPDIEKGICYGQSDLGVKDSFEKEVENILKDHAYLNSLEATIYTSPLKRCHLLAKKLFHEPILLDDRLKELDFGSWELKRWDAINSNNLSCWMKDFVHVKTENGESYLDLEKRVLDFLETAVKQTKKNIIIVTHAGVIRTILAHYNAVELKDSFQFKIAYGQVFKLPFK